ncbi:MAG: hypothetical protein AB7N80_01840 [Bdellovibrionales bacterium]
MGKLQAKQSLRSRRYRRLLFSAADLTRVAPVWAERLAPLERAWRTGSLTDAETAALYLLIGLEIRCPGTWLVGPSANRLNPMGPSLKITPWLNLDDRMKQWLTPETTLADILSGYSLRGVRLAAREILLAWLANNVTLRLTDKIPTPEQMLGLQSQGSRWVSVLFGAATLSQVVHDERDALSFLLHDLGHAAQFFSQTDYREGQIGFYRLLQTAHQQELLKSPALHDPNWSARLNYLMADINTHPAHFVSVFWANARETFAKNSDCTAFADWRRRLYEAWQLKPEVANAHEKMIDGFCPEAAQQVIQHLNQVGTS